MARDPEKRARSREADKIRKRAKRELQNMQTRYNESFDFQERRRLREQIKSLQADIAASYVNPKQVLKRQSGAAKIVGESALVAAARKAGSKTTQAVGQVAGSAIAKQALGRLSQREGTTKQKLSQGIDFQSEFREANKGGVSLLGPHGDIKIATFYRVTQGLWEGKDLKERNEAILEGLGVSSLRAAYAKVMNMPEVRRIVRQMMEEEDSGHVIESTTDMAEAYYSADRGTAEKKENYPVWLFAMLPVIESIKAYGA